MYGGGFSSTGFGSWGGASSPGFCGSAVGLGSSNPGFSAISGLSCSGTAPESAGVEDSAASLARGDATATATRETITIARNISIDLLTIEFNNQLKMFPRNLQRDHHPRTISSEDLTAIIMFLFFNTSPSHTQSRKTTHLQITGSCDDQS